MRSGVSTSFAVVRGAWNRTTDVDLSRMLRVLPDAEGQPLWRIVNVAGRLLRLAGFWGTAYATEKDAAVLAFTRAHRGAGPRRESVPAQLVRASGIGSKTVPER